MLLGGAHAVAAIANHTILNLTSPEEYRGRVNSIFMFTWNISPLGALPAGWIADQVGAPLTVGASGALAAVSVGMAALWLTALRRFRDADYAAVVPRPAAAGG